MNDIFISYSRSDSKAVDAFVERFIAEGFSVWIDRSGIESGDAFKRVIVKAIQESSVVVFFSSKASNSSKWTAKEIGVAVSFSKPIIPVKLDKTPYGEEVLFDLVNLDFIDNTDFTHRKETLDKLVRVLSAKLNTPPKSGSKDESDKKKRKFGPILWLIPTLISVLLLCLLLPRRHKGDIPAPSISRKISRTLEFMVDSIPITMVHVDAASYLIGAQKDNPKAEGYNEEADEDESPVHTVLLNDYYIMDSEVTQGLWMAVMGSEPENGGGWHEEYGRGDNYPAYNVTWLDAQSFIAKLNSMTGVTFRLPNEEEWEVAAKGGRSHSYVYAGSDRVDYVCWYAENSGGKTSPVKTKHANSLHLFDMSGNVWEWCSNFYFDYSDSDHGETSNNETIGRSCRGGAWGSMYNRCRVTTRKNHLEDHFSEYLGFRLAMDVPGQEGTGEINGHEWIDLGLSVKWASCNIGASSPANYGSYFAWGETVTKSDYSWENYKFRVSGDSYDNVVFSKYNTQEGRGDVDGLMNLEPEDDAARINWGDSWRMPTLNEIEELQNKCTWTWTTRDGISGYKVTSQVNGNSIFLPASGYLRGSSSGGVGSAGYCWCSSLSTTYPNNACYLFYDAANVDWYDDSRSFGRTVRPVTE